MPSTYADRRARGRVRIADLARTSAESAQRLLDVEALLVDDVVQAHRMIADMVSEYQHAVSTMRVAQHAKTLKSARGALDRYLREIGDGK